MAGGVRSMLRMIILLRRPFSRNGKLRFIKWSLTQLDVVNGRSDHSHSHSHKWVSTTSEWKCECRPGALSQGPCNCPQFKSVRSKRLANVLVVLLRRNVTDASCSHTGRVQRSPYPPSLVYSWGGFLCVLCSFLFFHIFRRADI